MPHGEFTTQRRKGPQSSLSPKIRRKLRDQLAPIICPRPLLRSLPGALTHCIELIAILICPFDLLDQWLDFVSLDAPAFHAVAYQRRPAGICGRQHWYAASHRLTNHQTETFGQRREHEQINLRHQLEQFCARECAEILEALGV